LYFQEENKDMKYFIFDNKKGFSYLYFQNDSENYLL